MSTLAKSLLVMTVLSGIAVLALPDNTLGNVPPIIFGSCLTVFLLALFAGRKIKFDPVLR
ncbi:PA3371 family protein [Pseudomonas sp. PH1b]|uniref:PA3371 family protein n=1 Tax=Pseudomonas sp. PH1b TaxID=1397282 RepID=UPI00046AAD96|nr:PA3371 family protein [Pseudomonas sp. PH1b]BFD43744.1 hypothetical protein FFPRI1PSEUD_52430 [Pseudomonas sp. FFPRI_1]